MIVTKHILVERFGVEADIAAFFADRCVPLNNLFWPRSGVYLQDRMRYISIPLFFDGLVKCGLDINEIFNEEMIVSMEHCFDFMVKNELGIMNDQAFLQSCLNLCYQKQAHWFYSKLEAYLKNGFLKNENLGTCYQSLNRCDAFLLAICFTTADAIVVNKFLDYWYSFIGCILILDDLADLESDLKDNDLNIFIELGNTKEGDESVKDFYRKNARSMLPVNKSLYDFFSKVTIMYN